MAILEIILLELTYIVKELSIDFSIQVWVALVLEEKDLYILGTTSDWLKFEFTSNCSKYESFTIYRVGHLNPGFLYF